MNEQRTFQTARFAILHTERNFSSKKAISMKKSKDKILTDLSFDCAVCGYGIAVREQPGKCWGGRKFVTLGNKIGRSRIQRVDAILMRALLRSPALGNVKRPLEQQVGVVVVIEELGDGIVVAAGQHTRGSFFLMDWKEVRG